MLNLKTKEISGKEKIFQIDLKGVLDSSTSDSFISFLQEKIDSGIQRFIIDCKSLSYITSSGISTLIRINRETTDKKLALVYSQLNSEIKSLFSLFGFNKKFLIAEDNLSAEKILQNVFLPKTEKRKVAEPEFGNYKKVEFSFNDSFLAKDIKGEQNNIEQNAGISDAKKYPLPIDLQIIPTDWVKTNEAPSDNKISLSFLEKMKSMPSNESLIGDEKIRDLELGKIQEKIDVPLILPKFEFHESIFHCESCGKVIRVQKAGKHQCPSCDSIFTVRPSGSVTYLEKLT